MFAKVLSVGADTFSTHVSNSRATADDRKYTATVFQAAADTHNTSADETHVLTPSSVALLVMATLNCTDTNTCTHTQRRHKTTQEPTPTPAAC